MKGNASKRRAERTALVAGGAGFLGSHLCDMLLAEGWRVICVDNLLTGDTGNLAHLSRDARFDLIEHDVCEELEVSAPLARIYNLACAASPPRYQADPVHTLMTSVLGARRLLALAEANGARYLQASTSEVYGDPLRHPQSEDYWGNVNPTGPRACYDEGKRAGEALCFDHLRLGLVDVRVARIFNTYGPRMHPEDGRIVSNLVVQALRDQPLTIYGDGEQTRSFCYVSDLVDGLMRLMECADNPRTPINLGNPGEFTMLELAALVLQQTGSTAGLRHEPLPKDDPQRRRPEITLARSVLGWTPRVPLAEGLSRTIDWFRERIRGRPERPNTTPAEGVRAGAAE